MVDCKYRLYTKYWRQNVCEKEIGLKQDIIIGYFFLVYRIVFVFFNYDKEKLVCILTLIYTLAYVYNSVF